MRPLNPSRADLLLLGETELRPVRWWPRWTGFPGQVTCCALSFFSALDPRWLPPYPTNGARRTSWYLGFGRIIRRLRRLLPAASGPNPITNAPRTGDCPGRQPGSLTPDSPYLVMALFSRTFGIEQKDWPGNTRLPFLLLRTPTRATRRCRESRKISQRSPPPVVFTLGSGGAGCGESSMRFFSEGRHPPGDSRRAVNRKPNPANRLKTGLA